MNIATLERYYNLANKAQSDESFFRRFYEYIDLTNQDKQTDAITDHYMQQPYVEWREKLKKAEAEAVKAIKRKHEEVRKKVVEAGAQERQDVVTAEHEYQSYLRGDSRSSRSLATEMHDRVYAQAKALLGGDADNYAKSHYVFWDNGEHIKEVHLVPEYADFQQTQQDFRHKQRMEIWGLVPQISEIFWTIRESDHEYRDRTSEMISEDEGKALMYLMDASIVRNEWRLIQQNKRPRMDKFHVFDRQCAQEILDRLHALLVTEIERGSFEPPFYGDNTVQLDSGKRRVLAAREEIKFTQGLNRPWNLIEFLFKERTTQELYEKKIHEYKNKQHLLGIELEEYTKADHDYKITLTTVLKLVSRIKKIFESSKPAEKRALLNMLLSNPHLKEKKLYFSIASPFSELLDLTNCPDWLRGLNRVRT